MTELPSVLARGERARLFPVLADTSKEGRTLSIFLSCLQNVDEFGRSMLADLGKRVGTRSKIETFTEVGLSKSGGDKAMRPDGLILITAGSSRWTALVEAKVGNTDLTVEQVSSYAELARLNGVNALITLSNQFAPLPSHHPVNVPSSLRKKVDLYHWSWMYVITMADLLLSNDEVIDRDQRIILQEMKRFLLHQSSGVKSFEQMPLAWTEILSQINAGASIPTTSSEAREVVGAWHQEIRNLSLILSRQLGVEVDLRVPRSLKDDPAARQKADLEVLALSKRLEAVFDVPSAASPIELIADLAKKSISVSMKLRAPIEKKSAKGRTSWLLRQLAKAEPEGIHVRFGSPGRTMSTQHSLKALKENSEIVSKDRGDQAPHTFEVLLVKDLGSRFSQRKNFISDLEKLVPDFYNQIGQHLRAWQAPAPKLSDEKASAEAVAPEALREEAEISALEREG